MPDEFCCPLALEYESSFCQYGICPVGCIGQNLMCLPSFSVKKTFFSLVVLAKKLYTPCTLAIGFLFSMLTFQHWSRIFIFLTSEMGRKLMFNLYQPFPVMSVINVSVSLAKQQALGLCSQAGEWNVAVSSLSYCTVRMAQWLFTASHVAGRRSDVSLPDSPQVTWYLSLLSFHSASATLCSIRLGSGPFSVFTGLRGTLPHWPYN